MSEQRLLFEIVEALEEQGLDQDEYQLQCLVERNTASGWGC